MKKNSTPYDFEGRIPLSQAIPLGLQHVMAMFIGNLTPLIIVMGLCGLTADAGFGDLRTALLQNAMVMAGIVTLWFPVSRTHLFHDGQFFFCRNIRCNLKVKIGHSIVMFLNPVQ